MAQKPLPYKTLRGATPGSVGAVFANGEDWAKVALLKRNMGWLRGQLGLKPDDEARIVWAVDRVNTTTQIPGMRVTVAVARSDDGDALKGLDFVEVPHILNGFFGVPVIGLNVKDRMAIYQDDVHWDPATRKLHFTIGKSSYSPAPSDVQKGKPLGYDELSGAQRAEMRRLITANNRKTNDATVRIIVEAYNAVL